MSEQIQYPPGIEYRTPRPRGTFGGALLGALFGYALTQNPSGAMVGGTIGGALGNQPMPLHQAIQQIFREKGLEFINFYRLGRFTVHVLFKLGETFWVLESHAPQLPAMTTEQIEDWLYGDLINKVDIFLLNSSHT